MNLARWLGFFFVVLDVRFLFASLFCLIISVLFLFLSQSDFLGVLTSHEPSKVNEISSCAFHVRMDALSWLACMRRSLVVGLSVCRLDLIRIHGSHKTWLRIHDWNTTCRLSALGGGCSSRWIYDYVGICQYEFMHWVCNAIKSLLFVWIFDSSRNMKWVWVNTGPSPKFEGVVT